MYKLFITSILADINYTMITHTISLIYVVKFTFKRSNPVCTQQRTWLTHVARNVLKKPALSGPLKSDIGTVQDCWNILTESKAYWGICHSYHKL